MFLNQFKPGICNLFQGAKFSKAPNCRARVFKALCFQQAIGSLSSQWTLQESEIDMNGSDVHRLRLFQS